MQMADFQIDDTVDITDVVCPVTFVKAKVALEELDDGQILSIRMNDGERIKNTKRKVRQWQNEFMLGILTARFWQTEHLHL